MDNLRPVTFNYYHPTKHERLKGEGRFHQWSVVVEYLDEKYLQNTYALVEDSKGNMHSIYPNCIVFQDTKAVF